MPVRSGSAKDIADGEMHVVDVEGVRVTVVSVDGAPYAFDDTCTHAGCSLAKGSLDGTIVTCACHGSQFDVTSGAVVRGPARKAVRSRSVQVNGDELLIDA